MTDVNNDTGYFQNPKFSINHFLAHSEEIIQNEHSALFFDWYCSAPALKARATKMATRLKCFVDAGLINGDDHYVWFTNQHPPQSECFDDMRISRLADDVCIGGICPSSGNGLMLRRASIWKSKECKIDLSVSTLWSNHSQQSSQKASIEQKHFPLWKIMKSSIKTDEDFRDWVRETFNPPK